MQLLELRLFKVWLEMEIKCKLTRMVSSRRQIESLAFSSSGDYLAACFSDGSVRLYSVEHKEDSTTIMTETFTFKEHSSNVWCVSFSLDGNFLSSSSSDHRVIIYSLKPFSVYKVFSYHSGTVWCCKFCKLSAMQSIQLLATASEDCTVQIVSIDSGDVYCKLPEFEGPVECLDYNENGEILSTASRDGKICLWTNLASPVPLCHVVYSELGAVKLCQFINSYDETILVSSQSDHSVLVFDVVHSQNDGRMTNMSSCLKYQLEGHCNIVWGCCTVDPSNVLATCSGDRTVR